MPVHYDIFLLRHGTLPEQTHEKPFSERRIPLQSTASQSDQSHRRRHPSRGALLPLWHLESSVCDDLLFITILLLWFEHHLHGRQPVHFRHHCQPWGWPDSLQGKGNSCLEGCQQKTLHWEVIEGYKTSLKSGDNDIAFYQRKLWC